MNTKAQNEFTSSFFKYRYINCNYLERSSRIFTHNEIYFASSADFNDPFDCKFSIKFDGDEAEKRKYIKDIIDKYHNGNRKSKRHRYAEVKTIINNSYFNDRLRNDIQEKIRNVGIFSISKVPDNILMWSHYAEDHKGFCLVFDRQTRLFDEAQEVTYSKLFPTMYIIKDREEEKLKKSILTKSDYWSYEKEFRILDRNGCGKRQFFPGALRGVIFGCKMTENNKDLIKSWCENRTISFYQASQNSDAYSLEITPL